MFDSIEQMKQYDIPEIDLVIVDLYPFEQTVAKLLEINIKKPLFRGAENHGALAAPAMRV